MVVEKVAYSAARSAVNWVALKAALLADCEGMNVGEDKCGRQCVSSERE